MQKVSKTKSALAVSCEKPQPSLTGATVQGEHRLSCPSESLYWTSCSYAEVVEMKWLLCAVLLLTSMPGSAADAFKSGNELLEKMKDCDWYDAGERTLDNYYSCGAVQWYVVGVSDAYSAMQFFLGFDSTICAPGGESGVTVDQLVAVVRKYLDSHPEKLHKSAASLVLAAFEAFPCE